MDKVQLVRTQSAPSIHPEHPGRSPLITRPEEMVARDPSFSQLCPYSGLPGDPDGEAPGLSGSPWE